MKKLILILAAVCTTTVAFSQTKELNNLAKKLEKSDEAIVKKASAPATWVERADLLLDASSAYTADLIAGFPIEQTLLILSEEPSSITEVDVNDKPYKKYAFTNYDIFVDENGSVQFWQNKKEFRPNSLQGAYEALQKAYELDPNGFQGRAHNTVIKLLNQYNTDGMNAYSLGQKIPAAETFAKVAETNKLIGVTDSVMIFYAGVAYNEGGDYANALKYMRQSKEIGYDQGGAVDTYIAYIQEQTGDVNGAIATLERAAVDYPEDNQIVTQLLKLYVDTDRDPQTIVDMLNRAKQLDQSNISLYLVEGNLWEQTGDSEKAEAAFREALAKDPNNFIAHLNTGILISRKGDKLVEEANKLDFNDVKGYNALIEQAYPYYTDAIEMLEKAHQIDPTNDHPVELLKRLYDARRDDSDNDEARYQYFDNLLRQMTGE